MKSKIVIFITFVILSLSLLFAGGGGGGSSSNSSKKGPAPTDPNTGTVAEQSSQVYLDWPYMTNPSYNCGNSLL
jgi:hypothetical protein